MRDDNTKELEYDKTKVVYTAKKAVNLHLDNGDQNQYMNINYRYELWMLPIKPKWCDYWREI